MQKRQSEDGTYRKILWIALLLTTWMIVIIWRLAWLQVVQHDHYLARAVRNHQKEVETVPTRGTIFDRNSKELAYSILTDSVFADLKLLKEEQERQKAVRVLAPLLGATEDNLLKKLAGDASFVWLKRKLEPERAQAVIKAIEEHKLNGVAVKKETQRFYPNDSLAAHLIGYVGADDNGLAGLEQTQDAHLRGTPGRIELLKDASGRPYERRESPPMNGAQVHTTIDAPLQHKVEVMLDEALRMRRAKGASAIVLDTNNGEILALANAPAFDPNERPKNAENVVRQNRSLSFPFEPGSVFKLVTYAAAFEENLVKPDDLINCGNGEITINKRVIRDTHPYGVLSVADAFAKSSNVGAIRIAQRVGKERLFDYIGRLGFGRKTGIELPGESRGIVNPLKKWRPDSIGSIAIGQEISVTMLQAVAAMAAIANRGLWVKPHIVKQILDQNGKVIYEATPETRRVISEQTAEKMKEILQRVVTHGTGRHAIQLANYSAAGKTGTPEKVDEKTKAYSKSKYMPSFAGFVPASNPRFAIIVMIDEPYGSHYGGVVAAPVFNLIAEAALGDFVVPPDEKSFRETLVKLTKKYESEMSDEERRDRDAAVESKVKAEKGGRKATTKPESQGTAGPGINISSNISRLSTTTQYASVKSKKTSNVSSVVFVTASVMPDFRGRGVRAVMKACTDLNLNVRLHGSGVAVRQIPAPGSRVRPGDECKVEFQ